MPKTRCVMIGGFLGAGKTSAMLLLAADLVRRGLRAGLITNDQSAGLVDTARVRAAGFPVREVTGGCFCCKFNSLVDAAKALADQSAPDVLIAEPVGSCTDILATVGYPLRHLHGERMEISPLSVVVDPIRLERVLGLRSGAHFSEKVLYVYRKQLEEAEIIVINKIDLLDGGGRTGLRRAAQAEFPRATIFEVSCVTEEGLTEWFDALLANRLGQRPAIEVDYDTYAQGEALLGWLNATALVTAETPFDGNAFLIALARTLREKLRASQVELAHLKMTLAPDEGPDLCAVGLTGTGNEPQTTHSLKGPLSSGELTINLRAEADPEQLERLVKAAAGAVAPQTVVVNNMSAFRPGRPEPTHRMAQAADGQSRGIGP